MTVQAVAAFRRVGGGFDQVAVSPGGFMPLRGGGAHGEPSRLVASRGGRRRRGPAVGRGGRSRALAGLGPADRRRLLVRLLGFGRSVALPVGLAGGLSLVSYAALDLPEERTVEVVRGARSALGTLDAVDGTVALLAGRGRPPAGDVRRRAAEHAAGGRRALAPGRAPRPGPGRAVGALRVGAPPTDGARSAGATSGSPSTGRPETAERRHRRRQRPAVPAGVMS